MKKIKLSNGMEIGTFEPPTHGFDPLKASPAELEKHGFPSRPTNARQLERYTRVMNRLKDRFQYVPPTFSIVPDKLHVPRIRRLADGTERSSSWSGGVVYAPTGQSFKWVQGDWVVPFVAALKQNEWEYLSSWIGIDGDGSSDVCQAGVSCDVFQSGNNVVTDIYPWWEWFGGPTVKLTSIAVRPGDMITVLICTTQGAGSSSATAFYSNQTTGASTSFVLTAPQNVTLVGNSAEWIVEAPQLIDAQGQFSQSQLPFYGGVFFTNCEAWLTNDDVVDGATGNNIDFPFSDGVLFPPTTVQCLFV